MGALWAKNWCLAKVSLSSRTRAIMQKLYLSCSEQEYFGKEKVIGIHWKRNKENGKKKTIETGGLCVENWCLAQVSKLFWEIVQKLYWACSTTRPRSRSKSDRVAVRTCRGEVSNRFYPFHVHTSIYFSRTRSPRWQHLFQLTLRWADRLKIRRSPINRRSQH